jgi:cation-transporting ATPase E
MIGDGVNDIIALKDANLGLAMQGGSPAARAAADVVLLGDSFAVLPGALVAGQRIVEGMRLVASLLLARTVYALLLVVLATVFTPAFPMTPRTNSILAMVTVGLPTLVIAAWAPPGRVTDGLLRSALRFAVPAGIAVTAVALPIYAAYLDGPGGVAAARTALTAISVWCGILLIPFLLPPGSGRDLRPTALAMAMAGVFGIVLAVPPLRELFELAPIPAGEVLLLAGLAGLWAVILFRVRTLRVVVRLMVAWRRLTDAGIRSGRPSGRSRPARR